jgi:hypothetical protein
MTRPEGWKHPDALRPRDGSPAGPGPLSIARCKRPTPCTHFLPNTLSSPFALGINVQQ